LCACQAESARSAAPSGVSAAEPTAVARQAAKAADKPAREAPSAAQPKAAVPDENACIAMCDKVSSLKCSTMAECIKGCGEMRTAMTACSKGLDSFMLCLVQQPVGNFECNDEGVPSVKDGFCDAQQQALASCLAITPEPSAH